MSEPRVLCQFKGGYVGDTRMPLLSGVDLTIEVGESLVFHGPSGGGKSTLLKALLGGHHVCRGEYWFQGQLVNESVLKALRRVVAYIPQQPEVSKETVLDYLRRPFGWKAWGGSAFDHDVAGYWFARFGLEKEILSTFSDMLSGGQRQRVSIIRALMTGRKILVADEPTSALDDEACRQVVDALLLSNEFTVISASHDFRWIDHCQRRVLVANGRVGEFKGSTEDNKKVGIV